MMKIKLIALFFWSSTMVVFAAQVDTLTVVSKAMHKPIKNVVIVPDAAQDSGDHFPVLYLLHGASGNYANWIRRVPELKAYADDYRVIIVCPDGGTTSWYFDSPVDPKMQYETYIVSELLTEIDKKYPTIIDRNGRAITGLSMGGHGALYLAFRHQEVWGAAGSMSGGVDIRPFPGRWDIAERLGSYQEFPDRWENNTVTNMVGLLEGKNEDLQIIFDCGVDDFFYDVNKQLHEKLVKSGVPHDYIERPGTHNWDYWSNSIKYQLLFFDDFFQSSHN